jgi:hypothetical protein
MMSRPDSVTDFSVHPRRPPCVRNPVRAGRHAAERKRAVSVHPCDRIWSDVDKINRRRRDSQLIDVGHRQRLSGLEGDGSADARARRERKVHVVHVAVADDHRLHGELRRISIVSACAHHVATRWNVRD